MNRTQGVTLIELLVAMALMGIILAVLLQFQGSTLSLSERENSRAARLQAINDISGYLGDRVKAAQAVRDTPACSPSGTSPCLAVVLPKVDRTCGVAKNWTLFRFEYVARSTIPAAERAPAPGLSDTGIYGLKETRTDFGTDATFDSSCQSATAPVAPPGASSSPAGTATSGYLATNLTLPTNAFEYDATKRTVTIRLRSAAYSRLKGIEYLPATTPYKLTVFARNLP